MINPLSGSENTALEIFEFIGYISFAVGKGLLSYVVFGDFAFKTVGYLNIISENLVVANLEGFYTRFIPLARFNSGYYILTVGKIGSEFVNFL